MAVHPLDGQTSFHPRASFANQTLKRTPEGGPNAKEIHIRFDIRHTRRAQASQQTNHAGTYRCGPDAKSCEWSGTTFTLTQNGNSLEAKNEKSAVGTGTVTSPISVSMGPPWNMLGVVSADGRSIEWSNGTQWRKQ